MTRRYYIEQILRQVYGDYLRDDSTITYNLVNGWVNQGIALAAKTNYSDALKLDNVGYVNNAFYTSFKGITVSADERFTWKITLPQIPIGVGKNEGISTLQFKDGDGNVSFPCIPISENQRTYFQAMRPIPNKTLFYNEGIFIYALSTLLLSDYTASVGMISGGDSTNLDSVLNVPDDYVPVITDYVTKMLILERSQKQDDTNDGSDTK